MKWQHAWLAMELALVTGGGWGSAAPPTTILVSVAASMRDAAADVAAEFERTQPGVRVSLNVGPSGVLARQIEQGAPVDVFVSASRVEIDQLREKKLLAGEARVLARNRLVLIVPADSPWAGKAPRDVLVAPEVKRIATGDPESVPFGRYAKQALAAAGLWSGLEGRWVYAADVRQALAYAERGEVDAAIVYASDAVAAKNVKELGEVPGAHDLRIEAVGARLARSTAAASERFLEQLAGPAGTAAFTRRGFSPP